MEQYTINTYIMKREIINFSNKLSEGLNRPERKFYTDMTYGMLASCSCLLTDIAQALQEDILKINVVYRLSRHLAELNAINALNFYIGVCMAFLGHMTQKSQQMVCCVP